jgi:hypothetical protein
MPIDQYEDEDDKDNKGGDGPTTKFKEFDCPSCNANNPCDPPFGDGEELLCNYCGTEYKVKVTEAGRIKLKEV